MRLLNWLCCLIFGLILNAAPVYAQDGPPTWHGLTVKKITPELMAKHGLLVPFGVVIIGISEDGTGADTDLRVGDLIQTVDGKPSPDARAFKSQLGAAKVGADVPLSGMRARTVLSATLMRPVPTLSTSSEDKPAAALRPWKTTVKHASAPPQLILDTGGHMVKIQDVLFTPDGRYIVSASDDKVIRIWDWRTGKTVRTIRGSSARGDVGKVYAIALSPDGRWLAAGGWTTDKEVQLYDFATGQLVALLKGHTNVVNDLAFSPDSRMLISGQAGRPAHAILWDVSTPKAPRILHRLEGHALSIYAVRFTSDGKRVVTGSDDTTLRLWQVSTGQLIKEMRGHSGDIDRSLAVRSSDGMIASGDLSGEIRLWDGKTGAFLRTLVTLESAVGALVFSPNGRRLLSTKRRFPVHSYVFDVASGKKRVTYAEHDNIVIAAAISPNGRYAATGGGDQQTIHIWELATGKRVKGPDGRPLSLVGSGDPRWAVGFSADGRDIAWGNLAKPRSSHNNLGPRQGPQRGPFQFRLRLPTKSSRLGQPERIKNDKGFVRAHATSGDYSLSHRKGGRYRRSSAILDIIRDGERIASITRGGSDGFRHSAYTFTPDGKSIISGGSNGVLEAFDLTGKRLHSNNQGFIGHQGDIWAVTPSPDGRFLVSGSDDQTVRLWNLQTRELIVTLFHGNDGKWVMWTPQGFYTGSPGAGDIVGWQINKGADKAADYVTGQQLRKRLLRPDIVERAIVLVSATAAIKEADLERLSIASILASTPPKIRIDAEHRSTRGRGTLGILFAPNELPVTKVNAFVDGVRVTLHEKEPPDGKPSTHPDGSKLKVYDVPLHKGVNIIRVVAVNAAGESVTHSVKIIHGGDGELNKRGTLWLLAVGVDKYPGVRGIYKDLRFAGHDARVFAQTVTAAMKAGHERVEATVLVNGGADGEPTADKIIKALQRISAWSRDNDTVIVFLAGHGETWTGGRYHFLPTDVVRSSRDQIGRNVIDWVTVQKAITSAKGRKLIFVDACRTGAGSYNARLLQDANSDGYIAFNAASANQSAYEYASEQHGAFAYALIKGFRGGAVDATVNGITVYELGNYVYKHVVQRTSGAQTPQFYAGRGNVVLAR